MNSNSLNSRFLPDALLTTRAVLSLNDDVLVGCKALNKVFIAWLRHPDRMVGFFPRLLTREPTYSISMSAGQQYNLILTNGAFLDANRAFPLYWHANNSAARAVVDEMLNCEDILMNLIWANAAPRSRGEVKSSVMYVSPGCFVETGRLSMGTGISLKAGHVNARRQCGERFAKLHFEPPVAEIMQERGPKIWDLTHQIDHAEDVVAQFCKHPPQLSS